MRRNSCLVGLLALLSCKDPFVYRVAGDLQVWHPIQLTVQGPEASETGDPNPFAELRMVVSFRHEDGEAVSVPGYFAADGQAADSGSDSGNQWRAHFVPHLPGLWEFEVSLRQGAGIATDTQAGSGRPVAGDSLTGSVTVTAAPERAADPLDRGKLLYSGTRYLRFGGNGEYFLKSGADSPENFLAYVDFDGLDSGGARTGEAREGEAPTAPLHQYEPHRDDWRAGDPTWGEGRGKGIIGALNYLASRDVNSVYFLTMNIGGDGDDVWPYRSKDDWSRFDCSRLDQWNRVFDHMDRLGIQLHVVLTETENESIFEAQQAGETDFAETRRLYYRELIARFSHHLAVTWNLGEENGWDDQRAGLTPPKNRANTDAQRKSFADYIRLVDPYDNPIVVHTLPGRYDEIYTPLLGWPAIDGPSLQIGELERTYEETLKWVQRSADSGRPWFVCLDEIGPASKGVVPDEVDPEHDDVRRFGLWSNLMAGGAGVEWYFGYQFPHNDLNLEDFRSRQHMWELTGLALEFFRQHLPFPEMDPADELIDAPGAHCLAQPGAVYAVYLGEGGSAHLDVEEGAYRVAWFDPRKGGRLQEGSVKEIQGPGRQALGTPPSEAKRDWVVLVRKESSG